MDDTPTPIKDTCKTDLHAAAEYRGKLPDVARRIIDNCHDQECYLHVDFEPIPSRDSVIDIINRFREILFPGYFTREKIDPVNLSYYLGQAVTKLYDLLSEQIIHSIRHDCFRYHQACVECRTKGYQAAITMLESVPEIRRLLSRDVRATLRGDPAAKSEDEIIFSYPGIFALTVYRLAHRLSGLGVGLLPRIMTEYAHSETGIDIHPNADIGESFAVDHGTGVVIGETTVIGRNVRIYQGVTLGALSLPDGAGERLKGAKRHPTIEDEVIIYSGATILGGDTVIGARSVIGGNVWLTESVPPDTKVLLEKPNLVYKYGGNP
jgi:serine O-acetyltransferase